MIQIILHAGIESKTDIYSKIIFNNSESSKDCSQYFNTMRYVNSWIWHKCYPPSITFYLIVLSNFYSRVCEFHHSIQFHCCNNTTFLNFYEMNSVVNLINVRSKYLSVLQLLDHHSLIPCQIGSSYFTHFYTHIVMFTRTKINSLINIGGHDCNQI